MLSSIGTSLRARSAIRISISRVRASVALLAAAALLFCAILSS